MYDLCTCNSQRTAGIDADRTLDGVVINACFHACFSIWHRIAVKAAAAVSCTHQQSGHSPQGSSYRTQEQQSKVRACRSAASPHTAGHDAHVGGLTWRPALSVIHPAPSYPDRIRDACEGASGAVRLVQAQVRLWQADLRRFSQPLGGVSRRAVARRRGADGRSGGTGAAEHPPSCHCLRPARERVL
eukprot:COSAG01_NODE_2521_length_7516_cov_101.722125_3_plen_187_part_00